MKYTVQVVETVNQITDYEVDCDSLAEAIDLCQVGDPRVNEIRCVEKGVDCDWDGWAS